MIHDPTPRRRQLADLLRIKIDPILQDWETEVCIAVPIDRTLTRRALRDSLRSLLEVLAEALEDATSGERIARSLPVARQHARQRFGLRKHRCAHLVREYVELRRVVVRHVIGDTLVEDDGLQAILEFFDAATAQAVALFDEMRQGQEQQNSRDELQQCEGQKDAIEQERDACQARTDELQEERRLRSQITAMVGHDMRAPLAAALLTARQLVKKVGNVPLGPERLERIMSAIERLNAMVESFLEADQLHAGQALNIEAAVCDLTQVFDAAHRDLAAVHGDRFVASFPGHLSALADAAALGRVLDNLANNAVKYGSDAVPIQLRLEKQGEQAVLSVHNAGPPVDALLLPRLFEPRYRGSPIDHATKSGWGLGLASVKAIAEAHGGSVDVRTAHGKGTTFYVRIPLAPAGVESVSGSTV